MDTESATLNALNIGADDGRKTANGTEKGKTMARYKIDCCYQCPDRFPACHGSCEKYLTQKAELVETQAEYRKKHDIDNAVKAQRYDSVYRVNRARNYKNKYMKR